MGEDGLLGTMNGFEASAAALTPNIDAVRGVLVSERDRCRLGVLGGGAMMLAGLIEGPKENGGGRGEGDDGCGARKSSLKRERGSSCRSLGAQTRGSRVHASERVTASGPPPNAN